MRAQRCQAWRKGCVNNCNVSLFLSYKVGTADFCAVGEIAVSCVPPFKSQLETYIQAVCWLERKL